ncbi:hypothetical protein [Nostoc sp.]|uniref:hypothetical protein n=1 Tax=Nostoc sp. TaxID=1180 RepID=UPI002FF69877
MFVNEHHTAYYHNQSGTPRSGQSNISHITGESNGTASCQKNVSFELQMLWRSLSLPVLLGVCRKVESKKCARVLKLLLITTIMLH